MHRNRRTDVSAGSRATSIIRSFKDGHAEINAMIASILNRVRNGLLPLALVGGVLAISPMPGAQSHAVESHVAAVSGEPDANLFDTHLIGGVPTAYDESALPVALPSAERCVESPSLLSPDAVFSPSAPVQPPASNVPSYGSLPAGQGALTAQNNVPAFLGDFFSGGGTTIRSQPDGGVVSIPSSTAVGLMKFAEGSSPQPRDRVFVSYNYFDNVNLIPGGIHVNRLTPGIEKTFFDGNFSVEVRAPMAWTLNSTTPFDIPTLSVIDYDSNHYEFGNLTTFLKALLYNDEQVSVSTGLGVALPTANDVRVISPANPAATLDLIRNQAVHLLPFVGAMYTPNDRWFSQGILQLDIPTNGNTVYTVQDARNFTLNRDGVLTDPTYLFASVSNGYWIHRSNDPNARLTGVALLTEFHFNTTLQATDVVVATGSLVGTRQEGIETVNGVVGTNLMFDQNKSLSLGYVLPIGGGADRAFDGEFRVLFNWYFGGPANRMTRAQF
jgi:hypothetical protein